MLVSKSFIHDFAYCANHFDWSASDIEECKQATRDGGEEMKLYWTVLAKALREGYRQNRENNHMRLSEWFFMRYELNPFIEFNRSKE